MKTSKEKKELKKKYKDSIPIEIKILFGKFYFFSFIYVLFLGVIFPIFLVNNISLINSILIIIVLGCFYLYIVIDVLRKKKNFTSTFFLLLILLVLSAIVFNIFNLFHIA